MLYWYFLIFWRLLPKLICIRRRQYPGFGEFVRDGPQTHIQLHEHMEYGHPDGGLLRVNYVTGFLFIFPIPPIGATSGADRQTDLDACLPAPVRIFNDLFALTLGAPSYDRADKLTR